MHPRSEAERGERDDGVGSGSGGSGDGGGSGGGGSGAGGGGGGGHDHLCLFGGAFNPPHRTHRRIVEQCLAQLPVRRLVVMPSGLHPFKGEHELAPAADRLTMCRFAFGDLEHVAVSAFELERQGPSFTVDTLQHYHDREPPGTRLYFVVGSDNLPQLASWHRPHDVLQLATLVTFPRQGHPIDPAELRHAGLRDEEVDSIVAHVLDLEPDDVSATAIRAALREGRPVAQWLQPQVEEYVRRSGLYGSGSS